MTKTKSVFALRNFRGLDKENKLLKVQPFRATDGYNFFIDSETLKTRPSFTAKVNPNFFLDADNYLIDWHNFGDIEVYITKKTIYLVSGNTVLRHSELTLKSVFPSFFNFEGKHPIFQEEKNCLFIFGLDNIFVVSSIRNEDGSIFRFVLYWLDEKPTNPYTQDNNLFFWQQFEDLPTPYVPTLLLGSSAFEDVNLLSKKNKYKLFANVPSTNGYNTYNLPTYYKKEKHGLFNLGKNVKVKFYNDRFKNLSVMPVYMGRYDEDWFGTLTEDNVNGDVMGAYGNLINENAPILIDDIYFAPKPFDFLGYKDNQNQIEVIDDRIYMTKEKFFNLTVNGQNVFDYLMNDIQTRQLTANKVLVFQVNVQFEGIYRDSSFNVHSRHTQQDVKQIYVQLRRYETGTITYSNYVESLNSAITSNLSDDYPDYPETPEQNDYEAEISANPIIIAPNKSFIEEFRSLVRTHISENISQIANNELVVIKGQLYKQTVDVEPRTGTLPNLEEDVFEFATQASTIISQSPYPEYPQISNPTNLEVEDLGTFIETSQSSTTFTYLDKTTERNFFQTKIDEWIVANQNSISENTDFIIFKIRIRRAVKVGVFPDPETGELADVYHYSSVIAKIFITPPIVETQERVAMTIVANVTYEQKDVEDDLFTQELIDDNTTLQLRVRNYFFDFNNEPSIDVEITFDQNTDYDIIADSTFGITFGSENRLFLAGNPEFSNIDRFNVSNDLLGDNVKNQSYELTYFPSKNYRVIGGKGAINGYVIATDSQMYVTKEAYPNDAKLFIRQRSVNEQGIVSYFESKTNITKTPLNPRCIVRFYNDILILAKDGLYGIELSQNVLTDERLVKLRSGFINKDIVNSIANYNNDDVFILENNVYMYIFFGDKCYVADSRYVGQASNSTVENVSYEIIEWKMPMTFVGGKIIEDELHLIEANNSIIYSLSNTNSDAQVLKDDLALTNSQTSSTSLYAFVKPNSFVTADASKYVFKFPSGYETIAIRNTDYTTSSNIVFVSNPNAFIGIKDGDEIFFEDSLNGRFIKAIVSNFESSGFISFRANIVLGQGTYSTSRSKIFKSIANLPMYVTHLYTYNNVERFNVSFRKPDEIILNNTNILPKTTIKFNSSLDGSANETVNMYRETLEPINLRWVSAITDFGNSQMEKTSFRLNIYATKQFQTNSINVGFKTIRRLDGFNEVIDLSNNFNNEEVEFNLFSLSTFDTNAISRPMKENNFLYIQFLIVGTGKIEVNAIEVLYKANRMLKSIG
jgi:hypothetical protein